MHGFGARSSARGPYPLVAVNMVLRYLRLGRWRDYLHRERVSLLLGLLAKPAHAWQGFAGALRPV